MRTPIRALAFLALMTGMVLCALAATAQVRVVQPAASGKVNASYSHPDDAPMAERLTDLIFRVKPVSDALHNVRELDLVVVHTQRELDLQLGPGQSGAVAAASYVRGILFLSPLAWTRNPTDEALEAEMERAMIRYATLQLTGGHAIPEWLGDGLVAYLAKQQFPASTAALVGTRAEVLLASRGRQESAVGYWAVRFLIEERGSLAAIQRLLRIVSRRPDNFFENFELIYASPIGELERDWRDWLAARVEGDRIQREGGVRRRPN